ASFSESIDLGQLGSAPQHLIVGLLTPTLTGDGFGSLRFQVSREGVVVVDQSFADAGSALAFFADRTLDLGPIDTGVTGPLDVTVQIDESLNSGGGFAARVLLADATPGAGPVPEPTAPALMA